MNTIASKHYNTLLGIGFALFSFFTFSVMNATNRYVLINDLMSFPLYFLYIKVVTVVLLLTFGLLVYKSSFFKVKSKKYVAIRALLLAINSLCVAMATKYLPLDIFYSLTFLMPLVSTILALIFLKEQLTKIIALVIGMGFLGAIVVIQPKLSSDEYMVGIFLTFIVIITGSASAIIARKYLPDENALSTIFYAVLLSVAIGILMSASSLSTSDFYIPSFFIWILIFLSATGTICGSTFFMKAFQTAPVGYVAPIQYTQLIWGLTYGYFLFGDVTTLATLLGCGIIIVATLINLYYGNKMS